jgi:hypothetical protein
VFIKVFAVALVLFALIETFASISWAYFNPAVTVTFTYIFPSRVKDKCDPYECKKPSFVQPPPANGGA